MGVSARLLPRNRGSKGKHHGQRPSKGFGDRDKGSSWDAKKGHVNMGAGALARSMPHWESKWKNKLYPTTAVPWLLGLGRDLAASWFVMPESERGLPRWSLFVSFGGDHPCMSLKPAFFAWRNAQTDGRASRGLLGSPVACRSHARVWTCWKRSFFCPWKSVA